jgi:hypothetical protein
MIKIDDDIPMPDRNAGCAKYPFAHLEVGQSFAVSKDIRATIYAFANREKIKTCKNFRTRIMGDEIRVWRVA